MPNSHLVILYEKLQKCSFLWKTKRFKYQLESDYLHDLVRTSRLEQCSGDSVLASLFISLSYLNPHFLIRKMGILVSVLL